jgi:hypothetical protein
MSRATTAGSCIRSAVIVCQSSPPSGNRQRGWPLGEGQAVDQQGVRTFSARAIAKRNDASGQRF